MNCWALFSRAHLISTPTSLSNSLSYFTACVCLLLRCYGKTCCTFSLAHAHSAAVDPPFPALTVLFRFSFHFILLSQH